VLVLQLRGSQGESLSIEATVVTSDGIKRRVHLSSAFRAVAAHELHVQIPLLLEPRDTWTNVAVDLAGIAVTYLHCTFVSVESVVIRPVCRLRRVFLLAHALPLAIPPSLDFPSASQNVSYVPYYLVGCGSSGPLTNSDQKPVSEALDTSWEEQPGDDLQFYLPQVSTEEDECGTEVGEQEQEREPPIPPPMPETAPESVPKLESVSKLETVPGPQIEAGSEIGQASGAGRAVLLARLSLLEQWLMAAKADFMQEFGVAV
jgi:hypothetical protein